MGGLSKKKVPRKTESIKSKIGVYHSLNSLVRIWITNAIVTVKNKITRLRAITDRRAGVWEAHAVRRPTPTGAEARLGPMGVNGTR